MTPLERSEKELRESHCLESTDTVAGRDDITRYKRRLRHHQALWRQRNNITEGHQRTRDGGKRVLGSRIEVREATIGKRNFLSEKIRAAVEDRLAHPEKHQTLNRTRLWSDLLSSMPMCFNLFGELRAEDGSADRAVGLIRFRGHRPKGGYGVRHGAREGQAAAA